MRRIFVGALGNKRPPHDFALCVGLASLVFAACGATGGKVGGSNLDAAAVTDDGGGAADHFAPSLPDVRFAQTCTVCDDFPADPVVDDTPAAGSDAGAPANAGDLFGAADAGDATGGPCLLEPADGSLFPRNWLRPLISWSAPTGQTLFEVRIHGENESRDLVVYTANTQWTMPKDIWENLITNGVDKSFTITIRGLDANNGPPARGSSAKFSITAAEASGTIVYWTTSGGSAFRGFAVGDESVVDVVRPAQTNGKCIGCHTSTPDGLYVAMSSSTSAGSGDETHIELRAGTNPAMQPPFLTPSALALMGRNQQELPAFSGAHWKDGDHLMLTMWKQQIVWTDLEAASQTQGTAWDFLTRTGDDKHSATYPVWSHDGSFIVYASSSTTHVNGQTADGNIFRVPFTNRQGGAATPVMGASDAAINEYYPSLSPDDAFIAFTETTTGESYNNPKSEVFVVPAAGGTGQRLTANDPVACSGKTSPGVTNSWPKWSPMVTNLGSLKYYWLTFSSTRSANGKPQLYVAPVTVSEAGEVGTHPALYLWNQPATEGNHTPAWDIFQIPPK